MKEQFNVRLDPALARLVKQAAQEQGRTVGGIVALALEAWLSKASCEVAGDSNSPAQQSALAALEARGALLEQRVARLEAANQASIRRLKNNDEINLDNIKVKNNDESRGGDTTSTKSPVLARDLSYDNVIATQENRKHYHGNLCSQGITTPELAIQTGTSKGAWNTWASKATIGDIRHHPIAGSWRLLGKAALASGGPPRWLWEAV